MLSGKTTTKYSNSYIKITTTSISASYKKKPDNPDNCFCYFRRLKNTLTVWSALRHTARLPWHCAGQIPQAYLRGCVPPGGVHSFYMQLSKGT